MVYKGCLPDGKEVAVKTLKSSETMVVQFCSEIEILTTLHHKNIISLLGFCFEGSNLLLVYNLLSRGSFEDNLHGIQRAWLCGLVDYQIDFLEVCITDIVTDCCFIYTRYSKCREYIWLER